MPHQNSFTASKKKSNKGQEGPEPNYCLPLQSLLKIRWTSGPEVMSGRALNESLFALSKLILTHCASPKFIYGQQGRKKSNKGQEVPEPNYCFRSVPSISVALLA